MRSPGACVGSARGAAVALALSVALSAGPARAEPTSVLRIATAAPDGTSWAREMKAFARDVDKLTSGQVGVKIYLGGIAGDEQTALGRVRRNQLDGLAGALVCETMAPSLRALRVAGILQSRQEAAYVVGQLRDILDSEFQKNGFTNLGIGSVGNLIIFSRTPIHDMSELLRYRYFIWNQDDVFKTMMPAMGMKVVPLPLEDGARAFDEGRIDGFWAPANAALVFQWSTRARNFSDFKAALLPGCLVVINRAMDRLSHDQQQALRTAAAKFQARFEDASAQLEDALLGSLFVKQGLKANPPSEEFRSSFLAAARRARSAVSDRLIPTSLLDRVLGILADYRSEHPPPR